MVNLTPSISQISRWLEKEQPTKRSATLKMKFHSKTCVKRFSRVIQRSLQDWCWWRVLVLKKLCIWCQPYDKRRITTDDFWRRDVPFPRHIFTKHLLWQRVRRRNTDSIEKLHITCDKFHEQNHTSCGKSFNSSEYVSLNEKNTQACEQTNSKLRSVASSCTFMNPDMFMRAIVLYLFYQNVSKTLWVIQQQ